MTKQISLVSDEKTGQVTSVIIRTTSIWYYVSPQYVQEEAKRNSLFAEAWKMLEKIK